MEPHDEPPGADRRFGFVVISARVWAEVVIPPVRNEAGILPQRLGLLWRALFLAIGRTGFQPGTLHFQVALPQTRARNRLHHLRADISGALIKVDLDSENH